MPLFSKNRNGFNAIAIFLTVIALLSYPASVSSSYSEYEGKINNHLQEGNNALAGGDLQTAIQNYEACLTLDPNQRYCNINLSSALVDLNESEQDEATKQRRTTRAISALRHVLRLHPKDGDAAFNLALLLQDSSRSEDITGEAARLYQIAVEVADMDDGEEDRWDALANMAAAKQELGEFMGPYGARRSYERSIVLLEGMVEDYQDYLDKMLNEVDSAKREYDDEGYNEAQMQINSINAYLSKLYYGYGTVLTELSPSDCLSLMTEESLLMDTKEGTDDNTAKMVCETNAVNAMRLAVDLDGNNVVAMHMLGAMAGEGEEGGNEYKGKGPASNEFVSALFDDFADTFDEKLGALGYNVPRLIGEAAYDWLQMSNGETFESALDAGCGTGLAGRFIRPLVTGPLVGVDLSQKMLDIAAKCTLAKGCGLEEEDATEKEGLEDDDERSQTPLYNKLVSSDLETVTLNELVLDGHGFDLIVAADVLVYLGDIQKLLQNFAILSNESSDDGASLIFSCERIDDEEAPPSGWKLQSSGRYAHSKKYVTEAAMNAGYDLMYYEEIVPRMEKGEPVQGHLFIFAIGGQSFEEGEEYADYDADDYDHVVESVLEEL
ncbi:hypothetical protein ACHAXR_007058 [Thalassiosira sp. AJA248-18]